ncbi:MAG: ABC transporter substrate-binding protein [Deltaproteobacteria bacterium]|nr:ABC transporter substrate-binding protein [Deltaproteobacteria bacterium]MBI4795460.1 ABC transporter substrate-binding protein [Deltaproteobacteria bacterium]
MKNRLYIFGLALVILCLFATAAFAVTPTAYVKGILDQVIAIQNDPARSGPEHRSARAQAIRQIIQKSFDFNLMAQNSLGSVYGGLSAGQRQDFVNTFSYLFQDSYTRLVLDFLKKETIKYEQERRQGSGTRVNTKLIRTNETIPVDYLMRPQGDGWLLYDVIVDGVSILDNYKRQFAQVIRTNSFDFLLKKMKTQKQALQYSG